MAHINLLPWREARREQRQKNFFMMLAAGLAFALLMLYLVTTYANSLIDEQSSRNQFLEQKIAQLNQQIKEVETLEEERAQLVARMQVIQELQQSRPKIVGVFDELVRTVPEGVHFESVSREGDVLRIQGVAQSNARVSVLMNQLDANPEFNESKLRVVQRTTNRENAIRQFTLEVDESKPEANNAEGQ